MPAAQNSPENIDELLALIQTSNDEPSRKALFSTLRTVPTPLLTFPTADEQDPLDLLEPAENTLAYAYILVARCYGDRLDVSRMLHHILKFLNSFDPEEARYAPEKLAQIAQTLSRIATNVGKSLITVKPLEMAINRFAPSPKHLTNIHQIFIKECLLSKCYKAALRVLDNDITEINVQEMGIHYTDHLLYHYYGGMIYIGLKKFERALDFFKLVISAPANLSSMIQVEAYKKFVLVSLLLHGKIATLPKYTAQAVFRSVKNLCQPYTDFANAFEGLKVKRVRTEFLKCSDAFKKDKNFGLAKQTLDALYRRNIQQLTQTYLTLSLVDIADAVGLEGSDAAKQAEKYVLKMIESKEIFATISHTHQNGMVSFHDNPDKFDAQETISQLEQQIINAANVNERVIRTDRIIGCSKEYLSRNQHVSASGVGSGLGTVDDTELLSGFDSLVDEGRYFA